ncbi:hypothetical protein YYC_00662 [Plasmodium yoelii 17X]|uniref:Zinc finger CCCH domain-containing protein n=4 Tax=Plasmodium yoelii TaxID=5861 RepID=A0AAE9WTV2_PLAYO|nr:uncharacterized protein PY17X_1332300 [Plasmodium yoelii]EAA16358.1 Zinc finger C-x8-C-x5-C-x3-H type, putative [Plasmodium yoelii yoelii]ETB63074.1 hypothetical protein YYC_00662 [Plasmodium yoelii 17X]WBY60011.1 zinc finger CCCH domain-containing protein [Plasmodium yoelii yoelii]CDU19943.1 conserved Plasmodium protein, unknown function [Plasmodium yoelii]VTZ80701.1 zinc finger protein, putative [Plasmodium yoelii]|eukprot:XP_724793.1 uncharacterized protein PY17X_1332300 [Plasmodium yoelii]
MDKINDDEIMNKISNMTNNLSNVPSSATSNIKQQKKVKKQKTGKNKKNPNKTNNHNDNKPVIASYEEHKKKDICKYFFKKGKCLHNENCNYSHDVTPIYKISKLCKFLIKGNCHKENCMFSHDYNFFFCRNNLINNSCTNPSCKFKHAKIDTSITNADKYNIEVDNLLSSDDKIRFLYNNKNYLTELLINKYLSHDKLKEIHIEKINKKDIYPWFINGIIDLIKVDFKHGNTKYFYDLLNNYKNKENNLNIFLSENNANDLVNNMGENSVSQKENDNSDIKKNKNTNDDTNDVHAVDSQTMENKKEVQNNEQGDEQNEEDNDNFNDDKFYLSEEEDYTQYLNKYFDMDK